MHLVVGGHPRQRSRAEQRGGRQEEPRPGAEFKILDFNFKNKMFFPQFTSRRILGPRS
jgi:hypothetical protein